MVSHVDEEVTGESGIGHQLADPSVIPQSTFRSSLVAPFISSTPVMRSDVPDRARHAGSHEGSMKSRSASDAPEKMPAQTRNSMDLLWAEASTEFSKICGESLKTGEVTSFEDVAKKIRASGQPESDSTFADDGWVKAKNAGLKSLSCLKLLLGAAAQAATFIPVPASAANIASSALGFVFTIPEEIRGYHELISSVFGEVNPALSQFQIYTWVPAVDNSLAMQIQHVMASFVRLCAHVVKYRQGHRRERMWKTMKEVSRAMLKEDSKLEEELAKFKKAVQQHAQVEGTVTLATVMEIHTDTAQILEESVVWAKTIEDTYQIVRETQQGVQSLSTDADRKKTLETIRDALKVEQTVQFDTNTTTTCTDIERKCLDGTSSWIWEHEAYKAWTLATDEAVAPPILIVTGPPSSGKTLTSARIVKRLEGQEDRTYVAHYFFQTASNSNRSDEDKNPVQTALKYMAFQLARVDSTTRDGLGKTCKASDGRAAINNPTSLENLWEKLQVGYSRSKATYYLVFDGLDNLPNQQTQLLLSFINPSGSTAKWSGRLRFLVGGTDKRFEDHAFSSLLRIQMDECNSADMRAIIDNVLVTEGMLTNAKPGSNQEKAREKIIEKLPKKAKGSFSILQLRLDEVMRLFNSRTSLEQLDRMLEESTDSLDVAIQKLQRSLTQEEISEVTELLQWVLFARSPLTLDELEAALFLSSGIESLAALQHVIKNKYSAVLKLVGNFVFRQDGIVEYFEKQGGTMSKMGSSKDRPTISMTLTIQNVDQEICEQFLWDLADIGIRNKFKFDFNPTSRAWDDGNLSIGVDEFKAHYMIVERAFQYLLNEPDEHTKPIGEYLVYCLPYHLNRLFDLTHNDKGSLGHSQQNEIGLNLFRIFKDDAVFRRHQETVLRVCWTAKEMRNLQTLLRDPAIVRRLDRSWRDEIQRVSSPARSYLKGFVKPIIELFLRERNSVSMSAWDWIEEFMEADIAVDEESDDGKSDAEDRIDWDHVSTWCRNFLRLTESDLDSLWYERLAKAAALQAGSDPSDDVVKLYQLALEKSNPSWLCRRGLGRFHSRQSQLAEAIEQFELALEEARKDGSTPVPEEKSMVDLWLSLGDTCYRIGDYQKAAQHFDSASDAKDLIQSHDGQLGYFKSKLSSLDIQGKHWFLREYLAADGGQSRMGVILKLLALRSEHEEVISNVLSVAKDQPELLESFGDSIAAAIKPVETLDAAIGPLERKSDVERETSGVLLYYLGVTKYMCNGTAGIEAANEGLRLWEESREKLTGLGGSNAAFVREHATTRLAKHYFHGMLSNNSLDFVDQLTTLADEGRDWSTDDATGFLASLYAIRGKKPQAKTMLVSRVKLALQMLTDEISENNKKKGFLLILKCMEYYQNFNDAVVALSFLCQPDLVAESLRIENTESGNSPAEGIDKKHWIESLVEVSRDVLDTVNAQVPDPAHQVERIRQASTYITSLLDSLEKGERSQEEGGDATELRANESKAAAYRDVQQRLATLDQRHDTYLSDGLSSQWECDGRTLDGKQCERKFDFENEMYHCVYCGNKDFCRDCLTRLRNAEGDVGWAACSAQHRWLKMPPMGHEMHVGLDAKTIRGRREVAAMEGDESILEITYIDDGSKITVEAWKNSLAREWDVSPDELRFAALIRRAMMGDVVASG